MDDNRDEIEHFISIFCVGRGAEETKLERKDDAMRQLGEPLILLHIFEAFEVKAENLRQLSERRKGMKGMSRV